MPTYKTYKPEPKTDPLIGTDFEVVIPEDVYNKITHWVDKSDHEVSGFGSLQFDEKEKIFTVIDAVLLKQDNSPTSSEIDDVALGKAMYEMKDQENGLKWWWHSHVMMNVFWSDDDMECIRKLGQRGWILATVFNQKRESRSAFYTTTEVMGNRHEIFADDLATRVERYVLESDQKIWDKEYDDKVTEKTWVSNYTTPSYSSNYADSDYYDNWLPLHGGNSNGKLYDASGGRWDRHKMKYIYNPAYDTTLEEDSEKVAALNELEVDDYVYLTNTSDAFIDFCALYSSNIPPDDVA